MQYDKELYKRIYFVIIARFALTSFIYIVYILICITKSIELSVMSQLPIWTEYLLNLFYIYMLKKRRGVKFILYFQFIIDAGISAWGTHIGGGLSNWFGPFTSVLLIAGVGILISLRASLLIATISAILHATCTFLEYFKVIIPPDLLSKHTQLLYSENIFVLTSLIIRVVYFYATAVVVGYFADLLKQREKELKTAEKFATLGKISSEIAHRIKNPLSTISCAVYSIQKNTHDAKLTSQVKLIEKSINKINQFLEILLIVTRPTIKFDKKPTDINSLIKELTVEGVDLNLELAQDLEVLYIDQDKIKEAFENIIINAKEAGASIVNIRTYKENNNIVIEFQDNGSGIEKDIIEKIFDPFFTTKHKDIGLGLAIAKKFIEGHKGRIKIKSKLGKGSNFIIILPKE